MARKAVTELKAYKDLPDDAKRVVDAQIRALEAHGEWLQATRDGPRDGATRMKVRELCLRVREDYHKQFAARRAH